MNDFSFNETVYGLINDIIASRNKDGGWGIEKYAVSTPVNTSQVLLALYEYFPYHNIDFIEEAVRFILDSQSFNGGWKSHVFADDDLETITTTTYCVLALLNNCNKASYVKQIENAISFIIKEKKNDSLWSNTNEEEISITASIFALDSLLNSRHLNKNKIDLILFDTLPILNRYQNSDGGFGFGKDDESKFAPSLYAFKYYTKLANETTIKDSVLYDKLKNFIEKFDLGAETVCEIENKYISGKPIQYQHVNPAWVLITIPPTEFFNRIYFDSFEYLINMFTSNGFSASPNGKSFTWSNALAVRAIISLMKNIKARQLIDFYGKVRQGIDKIDINSQLFINNKFLEKKYFVLAEKWSKKQISLLKTIVALLLILPIILVVIYSIRNKTTDNLNSFISCIGYIISALSTAIISFGKLWIEIRKKLTKYKYQFYLKVLENE